MLFTLRVRERGAARDVGFVEADDLLEAQWRGRKYCEGAQRDYISVTPAVVADKKSHPMPKEAVEKVKERVGA